MAIELRLYKLCRCLAQDCVGLIRFAVLVFEGLHLLSHLSRDAATPTGINLNLLSLFVQRLRRTADLRRDWQDRASAGPMLVLVPQNHLHCAFMYFR